MEAQQVGARFHSCTTAHLHEAALIKNCSAALCLQKVGVGLATNADIHLVCCDGAPAGRQLVPSLIHLVSLLTQQDLQEERQSHMSAIKP